MHGRRGDGVDLHLDQARLPQHSQVLGGARLAQPEFGAELPDQARTFAQQVEDPARSYSGDRPSSTLLLDDLDARTLGALIAFYEHRVFVSGVLLGINSFDQFGVELGKEMAKAAAKGGGEFDASTADLIRRADLD